MHDTAAPDATPHVVENGASPSFSADSRWLAYSIGYSEAERDEAIDQRTNPMMRIGMNSKDNR